MALHCSICLRGDVDAINAALIAGESDLGTARRFGCDPDAMRRHRIAKHFPSEVIDDAVKRKLEEEANGTDNVSLLRTTRNRLLMIGQRAEQRGDDRLAVTAYETASGVIEKVERIEGRLTGGVTIGTMNVVAVQQNFAVVQAAVLGALGPYPDARAAVLLALEQVEHEAEPS